jgi:hypothetical protein
MAYGEQLPTDSASKKFVSVLSDDTGSNAFVAIKGGAIESQNGEDVAAMEVIDPSVVTAVGAVEDDVEAMSAKLPAALSGDGNLPVVIRVPHGDYLPVCDETGEAAYWGASGEIVHAGWLYGILVNTSSSGTISLNFGYAMPDPTHGFVRSMPVTAGQYIPLKVYSAASGIYATLTDCTITVLATPDSPLVIAERAEEAS